MLNRFPYRFTLAAELSGDWTSSEMRRALLARLRSIRKDSRLRWQESIDWDATSGVLRVSCDAGNGDVGALGDSAIKSLAEVLATLAPDEEPTVRIVDVGVVRPPRPTVASQRERWGRYLVVLVVENALWLEHDPAAGSYISKEIKNWRRLDNASFSHEAGFAMMTAEIPQARSAAAAEGEARDALNNLISAAVKDPDDYTIKPLRVEWLSDS